MQNRAGGLHISVSIPDSILSEKDSLLLKTQITGYIARALAIFGAEELKIYHDAKYGAKGDMELLELILRYVLTPPYLRKQAFGMRKELKYVGTMPPVTIPSHTVEKNDRIRFGHVFKQRGGMFVHAGLDRPIELVGFTGDAGDIIPVEIVEARGRLYARPASFSKYSGFSIRKFHSLSSLLGSLEGGSAVIFTSRVGRPVSEVYLDIAGEIKSKGSVEVLFGGPKSGLEDVLGDEQRKMGHWLNTVEGQQVKTVRTEEALLITLGIINMLYRI